MRRYGHNLPADRVFVQVPDGPLWNVKLIMSNGETWLENGWPKFRDYHSITIGNFLLFDYDGTSRFNVLIFDTSSTEIQYQLTTADHERVLDSTTEIRGYIPMFTIDNLLDFAFVVLYCAYLTRKILL